MKNPYEVLGVRQDATREEIEQAYRELVKKYHPDRYVNHPLQDLAEEKMKEINEAYQYLIKNAAQNNGGGYRSSGEYNNYGGGHDDSSKFHLVREYLRRNDLRSAEFELSKISNRNAEWYFLRGSIAMRKGWYSEAYEDLQRAVSMDPLNYEYREALNNVMNSSSQYVHHAYTRRGRSDWDCCDTCACLCCTDQCCECCGGDLISCC
jgi:molecular chaperone DnaJ